MFRRGEPVQAVHVSQRGLIELISGPRDRIRYGPGELFFYEDLVESSEFHSRDAKALTPLLLFRLNRASFLTLILQQPSCSICWNGSMLDCVSSASMHAISTETLLIRRCWLLFRWPSTGADCAQPWRPARR